MIEGKKAVCARLWRGEGSGRHHVKAAVGMRFRSIQESESERRKLSLKPEMGELKRLACFKNQICENEHNSKEKTASFNDRKF